MIGKIVSGMEGNSEVLIQTTTGNSMVCSLDSGFGNGAFTFSGARGEEDQRYNADTASEELCVACFIGDTVEYSYDRECGYRIDRVIVGPDDPRLKTKMAILDRSLAGKK